VKAGARGLDILITGIDHRVEDEDVDLVVDQMKDEASAPPPPPPPPPPPSGSGSSGGDENLLVKVVKNKLCSQDQEEMRGKEENKWMDKVCEAIAIPAIASLISENIPKEIFGVELELTNHSTSNETIKTLSVSGTTSDLNGEYLAKGKTKSGKDYYVNAKSMYVYWDPDCSGNNAPPRWIFDDSEPSTTAEKDLDGDSSCTYKGKIDSSATSPPDGTQTWSVGGSSKEVKINVTEMSTDQQKTSAGVSFAIKELTLGDVKLPLAGSISWDSANNTLSVSAWKTGSNSSDLNKYVSLDDISLSVEIATKETGSKKLKSASALVGVTVKLGYGDSSKGILDVTYAEGKPVIDGELEMSNITFAKGITLDAGHMKVHYEKNDTSISFDANMKWDTEPSKESANDTVTLRISGSASSDGQVVFDGSANADTFLPTAFGLSFIQLGSFKIHANLSKFDLQFSVESMICVGEYQNCISKNESELAKVVVADAVFKYQCTAESGELLEYIQHGPKHAALITELAEPAPVHGEDLLECDGEYALYAKMSSVSISNIVSAVAGNRAGQQIPAILEASLVPIQPDCDNSKNVSECYFVVGVANTATKIDDQITLKPGFSLFADLKLPVLDNQLLVNMNVPLGKTADSNLLATNGSAADDDLDCTVALANADGSVEPNATDLIFSFTKDLDSATEKLKWDMSLSNALLITKGAIQKQFPDEATAVEDAYDTIKSPVTYVENLAASKGFNLAMASDFSSDQRKYFAVAGSAKDGGFGLTVMGEKSYTGSNQGSGMMLSLSMSSDGLSDLFKEIFDSDTDPFASVPVFSNANVAALVATKNMALPASITLPTPYDKITNVKKGLCLEGQLRKPKDCNGSPVCTMMENALATDESYLSLSGCINPDKVTLSIGIDGVKLSETTSLSCALGFEAEIGSSPSVTISAEAELKVKLEESRLLFKGRLSGELSASGPSIGLALAMSGMYPNAFGAQDFNLYDLVLGASVGVTGLDSFLVGGGLCFGKPSACATLTGNSEPEDLYQRLLDPDRLDLFQEDSISVRPHPKMAHEIFGSDRRGWPAHLQGETRELQVDTPKLKVTAKTPSGPQTGGAIAAKTYIGMDIADGNAFLYAAISEVSLMDLAKALTDSDDSLPGWLGKIAIEPYDKAKCQEQDNSGPACFAYMTLAKQEKTITMLEPNLVIPAGFSAQGTLKFFEAEMKFKIAIQTEPTTKFELELTGAPLKLWDDNIVIAKSADDLDSGPELTAVADLSSKQFELSFEAYAKVGILGSGSIAIDITNEQAKLNLTVSNIFGVGLGATSAITVNFLNPGESEISAALVLSPAISQPLKGICDAIVHPIKFIMNSIKKALQVLIKAAQWIINKFTDAQNYLSQCNTDLQNKRNTYNYYYYNVYQCNGGWYWGKHINCGLKLGVYGDYISAAQWLVNKASNALSDLRSTFQQVQNTLITAKEKVNEGSKAAVNSIEKVASFTLKELGFKASGVTATVELFAIVGFDGSDTTRHSFTVDLSKGIGGITSALKDKFLAGIKAAAEGLLNTIKDQVSGFSVEMELMEQLQDDHRAELVQLGFLKKQITAGGKTEYVHPNPEYRDARHEAVVQAILVEKQSKATVSEEL
jgi:hypothetical protein